MFFSSRNITLPFFSSVPGLSRVNKKHFRWVRPILAFLCVILSGCRALPERNYIGMTRDQVIDAYAETPRNKWNELYVMTVWDIDSEYPWNRTGTRKGLYFKNVEEIRENKTVRRSPELGIYVRHHWSGYTFHYEVCFENEMAVSQKIVGSSDSSIVWLPRWIFVDWE